MRAIKMAMLTAFLFLVLLPVFSQDYGTGAIFDPARYEQIPLKPVLLARDYDSLPKVYSLKQYSPTPGDQGSYGTCTGWATAFAARTISESIALNRTNRTLTSNNTFSPIHIYKSITNDPEGIMGSSIIDALNFIKNEGAVKQLPEEKILDFKSIPLSLFATSKRYPISDFVRLVKNQSAAITINEKVLPIKKSITDGKPVIISMKSPASLSYALRTDLWKPFENPASKFFNHAMCIVGYDDNRYSGAFEVINSWGTEWGSGGYIWIKYEDFAAWYNEAYEIIEDLTNFKDAANYSASIEIQVDKSTAGMPVTYDRQGFYRTRSSYPSETEFRFVITNRHPAYVYAFSADDSTLDTERIFPREGISPILDYPGGTIAWPGEWQWIRLNETVGTDYLVVLFSKQALDIDAIERRFVNERGTFPQRVTRAVGSDFIPFNNVQYKSDSIDFSADSKNPRAVLGLLLVIDHRARQVD